MLRLADTSVRMYRKKDGRVSLHLHSYLMILAKGGGYRLSTYLDNISGTLTFTSGHVVVPFESISFTENCLYEMDSMAHEFWASGITDMEVIKNTVATLAIEYKLFYHPSLGLPPKIEMLVPLLRRGPYATAIRRNCQVGSSTSVN